MADTPAKNHPAGNDNVTSEEQVIALEASDPNFMTLLRSSAFARCRAEAKAGRSGSVAVRHKGGIARITYMADEPDTSSAHD